jgi:hypothetical protein
MARAEQFDQRHPAFVRDAAFGWCELLIQARDEAERLEAGRFGSPLRWRRFDDRALRGRAEFELACWHKPWELAGQKQRPMCAT